MPQIRNLKNLGIHPNYDESYLGLLQAGVEAAEVEYEQFADVAKNIKLFGCKNMYRVIIEIWCRMIYQRHISANPGYKPVVFEYEMS